ncbi:MAG: FliI/YscN family ATPase [Planctomycetes bacterium]|nr:FliI/YscN family ATPase [Planctomycetota bacterium]
MTAPLPTLPANVFARENAVLEAVVPYRITGQVSRVVGYVVECLGLSVPVGSQLEIRPRQGGGAVKIEVIGFRENRTLCMPLGEMHGVRPFDPVVSTSSLALVPVGEELLGRVVDAEGRPLDGGPPLFACRRIPIYAAAPPALSRPRITEPLGTGIRAVDGLLTCGKGQRMGLFSGSGVGKSVLLGMMARGTAADVSVIALVGERGREVREFLERDLGPEGRKKSVVVVATSDESALRRVRAPFVATAIAEYFRYSGKDVLLLMDSITRMAFAQREIGLSAGEPPATKGYPPSVFALLPRLLERAGRNPNGSITGLYTVLVEADDINDPIADTARSILDGHLWLSRDLAARGQYPAIDPLGSVSRLMIDVAAPEHRRAAEQVKAALAVYKSAEDLINIGAYVAGSNPQIDAAVRLIGPIREYLRQEVRDIVDYAAAVASLRKISSGAGRDAVPAPAAPAAERRPEGRPALGPPRRTVQT